MEPISWIVIVGATPIVMKHSIVNPWALNTNKMM